MSTTQLGMTTHRWEDMVKGALSRGFDSAAKLTSRLTEDINGDDTPYDAVIVNSSEKSNGGSDESTSSNTSIFYANVTYDGWTYRAYLVCPKQ